MNNKIAKSSESNKMLRSKLNKFKNSFSLKIKPFETERFPKTEL